MINPAGFLLKLKVFENDVNGVKVDQKILVYNNQNPDAKSNAKIVGVVHSIENGGSVTAIFCEQGICKRLLNFHKTAKVILQNVWL